MFRQKIFFLSLRFSDGTNFYRTIYMKTYLYFAYGSNLNVLQMAQRCPDSVGISPAVLSDYKLVERSYADIELD